MIGQWPVRIPFPLYMEAYHVSRTGILVNIDKEMSGHDGVVVAILAFRLLQILAYQLRI
jgi:hypothetical protein